MSLCLKIDYPLHPLSIICHVSLPLLLLNLFLSLFLLILLLFSSSSCHSSFISVSSTSLPFYLFIFFRLSSSFRSSSLTFSCHSSFPSFSFPSTSYHSCFISLSSLFLPFYLFIFFRLSLPPFPSTVSPLPPFAYPPLQLTKNLSLSSSLTRIIPPAVSFLIYLLLHLLSTSLSLL